MFFFFFFCFSSTSFLAVYNANTTHEQWKTRRRSTLLFLIGREPLVHNLLEVTNVMKNTSHSGKKEKEEKKKEQTSFDELQSFSSSIPLSRWRPSPPPFTLASPSPGISFIPFFLHRTLLSLLLAFLFLWSSFDLSSFFKLDTTVCHLLNHLPWALPTCSTTLCHHHHHHHHYSPTRPASHLHWPHRQAHLTEIVLLMKCRSVRGRKDHTERPTCLPDPLCSLFFM